MKKLIQHHLNSLHIYCKLRKLGVNKITSLKISSYFEVILKPIIY